MIQFVIREKWIDPQFVWNEVNILIKLICKWIAPIPAPVNLFESIRMWLFSPKSCWTILWSQTKFDNITYQGLKENFYMGGKFCKCDQIPEYVNSLSNLVP